MNVRQLFEQGRVREAQEALSAALRDNPADRQQRTFLFELLCFSGDYDRAKKQLAVLAKDGAQSELGAVLYFSALHAEQERHELFRTDAIPASTAEMNLEGTLNGRSFHSVSDADSLIGARLEIFAAGAYRSIAFQHIAHMRL